MITIVILALVALFVGLRLYAVLGRRTGHEQTIAKPLETPASVPLAARPVTDKALPGPEAADVPLAEGAGQGVRSIVAADPSFDLARFLGGAQAAYRMILEAFWRGDEAALAGLADERVVAAFAQAIADRNTAGHRLDNRLVTIERATVEAARMEGQMAVVTVRFDADVAAVTRNAEGELVAGSLSDAIQTHDIWTFSRHVRADDPNWILIETDEA